MMFVNLILVCYTKYGDSMYLVCGKEKIEFEDCTTFFKRLIGFTFKKETIKKGKRFPKCNSIHTFFMFQKIDVIMTDKNNNVLNIYPNIKKGRIILPKKNVYYTYELPLGTCEMYRINDIIKIETE